MLLLEIHHLSIFVVENHFWWIFVDFCGFFKNKPSVTTLFVIKPCLWSQRIQKWFYRGPFQKNEMNLSEKCTSQITRWCGKWRAAH